MEKNSKLKTLVLQTMYYTLVEELNAIKPTDVNEIFKLFDSYKTNSLIIMKSFDDVIKKRNEIGEGEKEINRLTNKLIEANLEDLKRNKK